MVIAAPMPWIALTIARVMMLCVKPPPIPAMPIRENPQIKIGLGW